MKKILLASLFFISALLAMATDYRSMVFTTIEGEEHIISANGLEIIFNDGVMVATQGEGKIEIPVIDLRSMQFSEMETSIEQIMISSENPVEAYSLNGVHNGVFFSKDELRSSLPEGIYIISQSNGFTHKITIRK